MGNHISIYNEDNIFKKELININTIVSNIINEKNLFINRDYNFLSQDVCNKHYILMEKELNKHLKVDLKDLGSSLILIPKDEKSFNAKVNKNEICEKISNHYMKILYILCLIKYVYNLEKNGDNSISGIIFRNIKIVNDIMEINFCNIPHKNYQNKDVYKIDFSQLEGLLFLTDYFLDNEESNNFIKVLKQILGRRSKNKIKENICEYLKNNNTQKEEFNKIFKSKFNEELNCDFTLKKDKLSNNNKISLWMYVEKDNPVFSKENCFEIHKIVISLKDNNGKQVLDYYNTMKSNYKKNINKINELLNLLINKSDNGDYNLRDITKIKLDEIINEVKLSIKLYYIQSLIDYQNLLDLAKKLPNINVSK